MWGASRMQMLCVGQGHRLSQRGDLAQVWVCGAEALQDAVPGRRDEESPRPDLVAQSHQRGRGKDQGAVHSHHSLEGEVNLQGRGQEMRQCYRFVQIFYTIQSGGPQRQGCTKT